MPAFPSQPPDHQLPDRLAAVLAVRYLVFNQGWGAGASTSLPN
jgi:predicted RNA polymerase sigma factor